MKMPAIFIDGLYKTERRVIDRDVERYRFPVRQPVRASALVEDRPNRLPIDYVEFARIGTLPDGTAVLVQDCLKLSILKIDGAWTRIAAEQSHAPFSVKDEVLRHMRRELEEASTGPFVNLFDHTTEDPATGVFTRQIWVAATPRERSES